MPRPVLRTLSYFRPGACTRISLLFALAMVVLFFFAVIKDDRNLIPKIVKPFMLPGIFPLYVLGQITNSKVVAYSGFVLGTCICYGVVGGMLDAVLRIIKRTNIAE